MLSGEICLSKFHVFVVGCVFTLFLQVDGTVAATSQNLSCYQCTRQANIECEPHELKPCPSNADRCVTHIMKDKEDGFKISRECGLGPCTFRDLMTIKGLGMDNCDRSRDEYFCILCCRENGCNKDEGTNMAPFHLFQLLTVILVMLFIK